MMELTSWNKHAIRFIDAPCFEWPPVEGAQDYQVQFATANNETTTIISTQPIFDFQPYWDSFACGRVDWVVVARDSQGKVIDQLTPHRIAKAPDFDQQSEAPEDWMSSASRYADWLFGQPKGRNGEPVFVYSSGVSYYGGNVHPIVYPALHHSSHVFFCLQIAQSFPNTEMATRARQVAIDMGDWMLQHTLDASFRCSRFPLSTHVVGELKQAPAEENTITLFRAARAGVAMLSLYHRTGEQRFLDYAQHLAAILAEFQAPDGSWPYRVNPQTGEVVEEYSSAAICYVKFYETLQKATSSSAYQGTIDAAVKWTLENPARTNRWQGMYEDIGKQAPFRNLENQDALEVVRFLCRNKDRYENAIAVAEHINRYVEDQFIMFGPYDSHLPGQPVCPTVMEQYVCYWPMPGHTGNWLRALMALHKATGKEIYLTKAVRAANAITRLQLDDGRYVTWGVDYRFRTLFQPYRVDWFGNGARAAYALMKFDEYTLQSNLR